MQVDLPKLGLKLAWKPRGDSEWIPHEHIIPFPPAVIENPSRTNGGKVELANLPAASLDDTHHNTSGSSYLSAASSDGSSTPNSVIARSPSGLTLTSGPAAVLVLVDAIAASSSSKVSGASSLARSVGINWSW